MSAVSAYEALAALAERELDLVSRPEALTPEALEQIARERDALVATLPARPPAEAAPALARAAALRERITAELAARVAEVGRSLHDVARGRRTVRGYGGADAGRGGLDVSG